MRPPENWSNLVVKKGSFPVSLSVSDDALRACTRPTVPAEIVTPPVTKSGYQLCYWQIVSGYYPED
jgi:hypothetical protein